MTNNNAHINYSFTDIERYLNGGMTAKEMHDIERAALQDPFLADAIEGYRTADMGIAGQHLNGIAAGLQKEEPAKVILMPGKKRYGWLVAASLVAVIGTGLFLFNRQNELTAPLAINNIKKDKQKESPAEDSKPASQQADSQSFVLPEKSTLIKPEKEADNRISVLQKRKPSSDKEKIIEPSPEKEDAPRIAMAPAAQSGYFDKTITEQKQVVQSKPDSVVNRSSEDVTANIYARRIQTKLANTWTTDKGKPFLLSEVEVINIGKKDKKHADTSAIKPEGGWQSFQDYLFSRLSRHDSITLADNNTISDDLELEFSIDKSGSPYDVKVIHARDSSATNKIIDAIQSGPKWMSNDSKEKRLRLRY